MSEVHVFGCVVQGFPAFPVASLSVVLGALDVASPTTVKPTNGGVCASHSAQVRVLTYVGTSIHTVLYVGSLHHRVRGTVGGTHTSPLARLILAGEATSKATRATDKKATSSHRQEEQLHIINKSVCRPQTPSLLADIRGAALCKKPPHTHTSLNDRMVLTLTFVTL